LDDAGMKVMELRDNFDQATQIKFHERQVNRGTDDKAFHFEPPPGVDVIGEQ
jgi:outer membrane lipoprotein-sorting protein